jgi:hypothetical protein
MSAADDLDALGFSMCVCLAYRAGLWVLAPIACSWLAGPCQVTYLCRRSPGGRTALQLRL